MKTHTSNSAAVIGAIILLLVIGVLSYNVGKKEGAKSMHQEMKTDAHSEMSMDQMSGSLEDLRGDAFDKAFLEMMIVHHQGAIDMAKHIPAQAKHEELKKLGSDIITAQTKEIEMMKAWLKDWGYEEAQDTQHSSH